jgi:hypothetical protein
VRCSPWHDDRLPGKQSGPGANPGHRHGCDAGDAGRLVAGDRAGHRLATLHEVPQANRALYRAFALREELRLLNHLDGILAAIRLGLYNRRLEGLNSKIRLISQPSHRFHSAAPLIALIYLCCTCTVIDLGR